MFYIKSQIFLSLSKVQKTSLCKTFAALAKKHYSKLDDDAILERFAEDEKYYAEIGNPHFEWVLPLLDDEKFLNDAKKFLKEARKELEKKEREKPFLEKQKLYAKEQKKLAQENLMKKQPPTKKQLYYYEKLCKQHRLEQASTEGLSRLDLKTLIGDILDGECLKES